MHEIEPFYNWRDYYVAANDYRSPFHGREYNEFAFTNKVYNYVIHPQWDDFGSNTLYLKVLFTDYDQGFAIIEMIGEWNDCIHNDIMFLKRNILEPMMVEGIFRFIIIGENVLNFHASDDCYYEEWNEEVRDENGWITLLNFRNHVREEMSAISLHHYLVMDEVFQNVNWRTQTPLNLLKAISTIIEKPLMASRPIHYIS